MDKTSLYRASILAVQDRTRRTLSVCLIIYPRSTCTRVQQMSCRPPPSETSSAFPKPRSLNRVSAWRMPHGPFGNNPRGVRRLRTGCSLGIGRYSDCSNNNNDRLLYTHFKTRQRHFFFLTWREQSSEGRVMRKITLELKKKNSYIFIRNKRY